MAEILESREIKKREFAERIGLSVKAVSQIINGKALYSPDVALMLEKTLDVNAEIWMNLAEAYQLFLAREKERKNLETEQTRAWVRCFPTADLKRLGHLPKTNKPEVLADELLRFLTVSSPDVWDDYMEKRAVSYRKSTTFFESREATAVWLRLAEREAETIETAKFDRALFKEILPQLGRLTTRKPDEFYPQMVEECRSAGVALVLVPELKETHISGAACWVSRHKAVIAISLRYKTNDHFWFTFFHEAAHLLLHGKKNIYLDTKGDGVSKEEQEGNAFAGEMLIPEKEYSESIRIHPGLVVGRLQHDRKIEFRWHNALKERYTITTEHR